MNTMSSTKFHHLLYNINILGEELYKYLCFRSNPINYLYLSMYMYVVLNYEINMFKLKVDDQSQFQRKLIFLSFFVKLILVYLTDNVREHEVDYINRSNR